MASCQPRMDMVAVGFLFGQFRIVRDIGDFAFEGVLRRRMEEKRELGGLPQKRRVLLVDGNVRQHAVAAMHCKQFVACLDGTAGEELRMASRQDQ